MKPDPSGIRVTVDIECTPNRVADEEDVENIELLAKSIRRFLVEHPVPVASFQVNVLGKPMDRK